MALRSKTWPWPETSPRQWTAAERAAFRDQYLWARELSDEAFCRMMPAELRALVERTREFVEERQREQDARRQARAARDAHLDARWARGERFYFPASRTVRESEFWASLQPSSQLRVAVHSAAGELDDEAGLATEYLRLRTAYAHTLELVGGVGFDEHQKLERRDRRLRAQLLKFKRSKWDLVSILRDEIAFYVALLAPDDDADAAPASAAEKVCDRRRPPGRSKRTGRPTGRPLAKDRAKKKAGRAADVLRLLGRHANGLSMNKIQKALRMGRPQVMQTLVELERRGDVRNVGIGNDSRWIKTIDVVRKTPRGAEPKE